MEEKEISIKEESPKKSSLPWNNFFKDQFFLIIVGVLSFIVYLTIYFIGNDNVYLYLSFVVPCTILLWIGISAVIMVLKEKNKDKYNTTETTN
ncbi:MAG: hypothetical protein K2H06_04220 [Anaeroplasmataceae bacterium]|nr:hypothetical protein [Anaeroplasmataceae bacterium]